jgi:ligand-binding SRPBCC domain-containing protein
LKTYLYKAEQFLPTGIDKAWDFFSAAKNLAVITPPDLDFNILTDLDGQEIYEGMIIDYTVKPLLGVRVHWKTEICDVQRPLYFTDRQLKGPYKTWIHTHTFIKKENGIVMKDEITYQLPFGFIGTIAHSLLVKKRIEKIFEFRRTVLHKIFITHEYRID